ncbi:MAG: DUF29 domain-containing protein [Sulfurimicrobium sp.]|nr:DUF29 domain-containing protein [Sulfurimicrobium sp.]
MTIRHEQDFYLWTQQQANALKAGNLADVDMQHLAEEIESMGSSEKRELGNRLSVLIAHLLKWQHQPVRRGNSWRLTIQNQRDDIQDLLEDSPSLKLEMKKRMEKAYIRARRMASLEIGLAESDFPVECPFTLDEMLLNPDFWPGE